MRFSPQHHITGALGRWKQEGRKFKVKAEEQALWVRVLAVINVRT